MGRVLTNNTSLEYSIEATPGVLAGTPTWKLTEPNTINTFGAEIATVARNPISKTRQRRKGTTSDLDSAVEFEHDLTGEAMVDFIEGFLFATAENPTVIRRLQAGANFNNLAADDDPGTPGTESGFTHDALSAAIPAGFLVFSRGFTNSANNGLFEVTGDSTTTVTEVTVSSFVDETPTEASGASLEVAGVRAGAGDLDFNVSGITATITSTTLDFTTLGLTVGQFIHVGGLVAGNQFDGANNFGYARVTAIAANTLSLDKLFSGATTDTANSEQIDLLYGRFIRNVDVDASNFVERTFQFEFAAPNLLSGPATGFEYAIGNYCNSMALNLPLTDKATVTFGFVGLSTDDITSTRKTNAATPVLPNQTTAFNTSSDIARLRIQKTDETGITTCFKSLTLTFNNNVSPEKCLGTLGATFVNFGNFDVDIEAQVLFTSEEVTNAIKNNTTVQMDFVLTNDNGAIAFDVPSMTMGDGSREYPVNESVLINVSGTAFADPTLDTSIGVSLFPRVP